MGRMTLGRRGINCYRVTGGGGNPLHFRVPKLLMCMLRWRCNGKMRGIMRVRAKLARARRKLRGPRTCLVWQHFLRATDTLFPMPACTMGESERRLIIVGEAYSIRA